MATTLFSIEIEENGYLWKGSILRDKLAIALVAGLIEFLPGSRGYYRICSWGPMALSFLIFAYFSLFLAFTIRLSFMKCIGRKYVQTYGQSI